MESESTYTMTLVLQAKSNWTLKHQADREQCFNEPISCLRQLWNLRSGTTEKIQTTRRPDVHLYESILLKGRQWNEMKAILCMCVASRTEPEPTLQSVDQGRLAADGCETLLIAWTSSRGKLKLTLSTAFAGAVVQGAFGYYMLQMSTHLFINAASLFRPCLLNEERGSTTRNALLICLADSDGTTRLH